MKRADALLCLINKSEDCRELGGLCFIMLRHTRFNRIESSLHKPHFKINFIHSFSVRIKRNITKEIVSFINESNKYIEI